MKLILLSGGSGKRLWPLSNDSRSKQFLKILTNPHNKLESMVQRVWRQLTAAGLTDQTFIATCKEQVDIIKNQLGENIPLIIEPMRRDTFPAIALATSYLYSVEKIDANEVVCVLPVDSFVDDSFFNNLFVDLQNILQLSQADLALLGVTPTYPSEKYGYIVPKSISTVSGLVFQSVSHFIEKPEQALAKQLIEENALWNCGVFVFRAKLILDHLQKKDFPINFEELQQRYFELPKISFDYEIVEKNKNIVAKKHHQSWKDLGTWNTLTEEMAKAKVGYGIISSDSTNTHLINELQIPLIIQNLSDIIVAASPDGILVSNKHTSDKIKPLISELNSRPMFEERRWGNYRIIDYIEGKNNQSVLTKRLTLHDGKNTSYHAHNYRSEIWMIIKGEGLVALRDEMYQVKTGSVFSIPAHAMHAVKALSQLELLEIQVGEILEESDSKKLTLEWDEIEKRCKMHN